MVSVVSRKNTLRWLVVCTCAAAAAGWGVTNHFKSALPRPLPGHEQPPVSDNETAVATPPHTTPPLGSTKPDVRRQVRQIADNATQEVDRAGLERYLDGLLQQARALGKVTALQAEVGSEVIARLGGGPEMQFQFSERLNALARELDRQPIAAPASASQELRALDLIGDRIFEEADDAKRQVLVESYLEKTVSLPPEQQIMAMGELNSLVSVEPSPSPGLDSLWSKVEHSEGAHREAAIQAIMDVLNQLPPDELVKHTQRLNGMVRSIETHGQK